MAESSQPQQDLITLGAYLKGWLSLSWRLPSIFKNIWHINHIGKENRESWGLLLESCAARFPENAAVKSDEGTLTYGEYNARVNRVAHYFLSQGIGKGDTVAVFMENRQDLLVVYSALAKIGAVNAMINTNLRRDSLVHCLTLNPAKAFVVGEETTPAFEEVRGALGLTEDQGLYSVPDRGSSPTGVYGVDGRGARVRFAKPLHHPRGQAGRRPRLCLYLRHHRRHAKGGGGHPRPGGEQLLLQRPRGPQHETLGHHLRPPALLSHERPGPELARGLFQGVCHRHPPQVQRFPVLGRCQKVPCHHVLLRGGTLPVPHEPAPYRGGPKPPPAHDHRKRPAAGHLEDLQGTLRHRKGLRDLRGCGVQHLLRQPASRMPYAIVRYDIDEDRPVRGKDGFLQKVGRGEVGLILGQITNLTPFRGYTSREATESKILRDVFEKGDAWFNTGDLVRDLGFRHIQFVDRLGDTFRWKGENVSTTEVEKVANAFSQVALSACYGVLMPGGDGRAGMVAVIPEQGEGELDFEGIAAHFQRELPSYAVPKFIRIRKDFDYTPTHKIKKLALKK
ncbi:MAG: AMP-binding protein, partial [Deltaproteobacteria bacterium]|nr:AMP-binding protein [Deltaproteobacteria bacterium]